MVVRQGDVVWVRLPPFSANSTSWWSKVEWVEGQPLAVSSRIRFKRSEICHSSAQCST